MTKYIPKWMALSNWGISNREVVGRLLGGMMQRVVMTASHTRGLRKRRRREKSLVMGQRYENPGYKMSTMRLSRPEKEVTGEGAVTPESLDSQWVRAKPADPAIRK